MAQKRMPRGNFAMFAAGLFIFASNPAMANPDCLGPDFWAFEARFKAAVARLKAGDCSALAEWKAANDGEHAILRNNLSRPECHPYFLYPKPPPCVSRTAKQVPPPPQPAPQPLAPRAASNQQSASCSDITGLGTGSGPGNCTPSSGIPSNVQQQMAQAQSYAQAAQTVKQSDPTNTGWSTAAALYRKAAAAFQAAGDLAQAQAATDQAQTLETALKMANAQAVQAPIAPPNGQSSTQQPARDISRACTEFLRNRLKCNLRGASDLRPEENGSDADKSLPVTPSASGQAGAFRDCVSLYCRAAIALGCPNSDTSLVCNGLKQTESGPCEGGLPLKPGQHLIFPDGATEPKCEDNALDQINPQDGPNSTITGFGR